MYPHEVLELIHYSEEHALLIPSYVYKNLQKVKAVTVIFAICWAGGKRTKSNTLQMSNINLQKDKRRGKCWIFEILPLCILSGRLGTQQMER